MQDSNSETGFIFYELEIPRLQFETPRFRDPPKICRDPLFFKDHSIPLNLFKHNARFYNELETRNLYGGVTTTMPVAHDKALRTDDAPVLSDYILKGICNRGGGAAIINIFFFFC